MQVGYESGIPQKSMSNPLITKDSVKTARIMNGVEIIRISHCWYPNLFSWYPTFCLVE